MAALFLVLNLAAAGKSSGATSGMLGAPIKTVVEHSEFFRFYHLVPDTVESGAGGKMILHCKPAGGPFRDLTEVDVGADKNQAVFEIALRLSRSFIEDPQNGKYARDIAAYFLRLAPPASDAGELSKLAKQLVTPSDHLVSGDAMLVRSYAIFNGKNDSIFEPLSIKTMYMIENGKNDNGAPSLSIYFVRP